MRLAVTVIGPTGVIGLEPESPAVVQSLAFASRLSADLGWIGAGRDVAPDRRWRFPVRLASREPPSCVMFKSFVTSGQVCQSHLSISLRRKGADERLLHRPDG
jgi:hypothetical protein